jgi:hypothetical protein
VNVTTRFKVNMPPVIHQLLDGEVIAVNLDTGSYYSFAGVAAEIWAALEEGATVHESVGELLRRYDASRAVVEQEVARFVVELEAEGLIVPVEGAIRERRMPPTAAAATREPFEAPTLHKYTDMQELLVLDPIHEVDEAGWPHSLAGDGQRG